jgi:hypothetical protein
LRETRIDGGATACAQGGVQHHPDS